MRIGQNPAKSVETVPQPADITVTVVNCLPFLSGFYAQSLEVLKACLYSLRQNTDQPFDLMVFDNHSCQEVRQFLVQAQEQGVIQYLILSDKNIGKIGAWNYMFGAAQGRMVAFCDSDIYFRPGWLEASLELFQTFPNVGMVTSRPLRTPMEFSSATLKWGEQQPPGVLTKGTFLDWDTYIEHTNSIGMPIEKSRDEYEQGNDYLLTQDESRAYAGAAHFQFVARKEVLQRIIPLPSVKPMRGERALDIAINDLGYLRLCTEKALVSHYGNRLPESLSTAPPFSGNIKPVIMRLIWAPGIRHVLMWLYNRIFKLFFENVK
ncbi:MAG: glycosyltransferase [Chloroflexota bacterium]